MSRIREIIKDIISNVPDTCEMCEVKNCNECYEEIENKAEQEINNYIDGLIPDNKWLKENYFNERDIYILDEIQRRRKEEK